MTERIRRALHSFDRKQRVVGFGALLPRMFLFDRGYDLGSHNYTWAKAPPDWN
jgi:hypothetical protein